MLDGLTFSWHHLSPLSRPGVVQALCPGRAGAVPMASSLARAPARPAPAGSWTGAWTRPPAPVSIGDGVPAGNAVTLLQSMARITWHPVDVLPVVRAECKSAIYTSSIFPVT